MSDIEKRELQVLSNNISFNDVNVDWSFLVLFSKIVENGSVYYA